MNQGLVAADGSATESRGQRHRGLNAGAATSLTLRPHDVIYPKCL